MTPIDRTSVAVEPMPWGCGVRFEGKVPRVERDRARIQGILRRTGAGLVAQPDQPILVCTHGGLLAEIEPGKPAWAEMRKGSLLDAAG